ncbi:hypothetical protein AB0B89_33065 [Sphaerisporangium sp. NPDC049002]|uniref:hypothetical protein n=1 Tax=unclassified Sphaerisporangium TaxID=2630420 RepID=UPI0033EB1F0B
MKLLSGDDAPLWGPIWIEVGDQAFPEVGWRDYMASMFGSLVSAIGDLSRGKPNAESYFFNGSFTVRMARKGWRWRDRFSRPRADMPVSFQMIYDTGESMRLEISSEASLGEIIEGVYRPALAALEVMRTNKVLTGPALRIFAKSVETLSTARMRLQGGNSEAG